MTDRRKVEWVELAGGIHHHLYFRRKVDRKVRMAHVTTDQDGYRLIVDDTDVRWRATKEEMIDLVKELW